ncbi:MAG: pentapeptide repeat-containing protein, partial [Acidimicrobiia bacterium]|nr:pentapeptide repeat-containing protein [Acidimicrobiia bacterium]
MVREVRRTDEFRGARFVGADLTGATFRDVDLTGATFTDALLIGADISGVISGLRINGVDVAPLVEAELDRLHPERLALRGTDPAGLREGWATVEAFWAPTVELARGLPESARQQRVDDEWSFVETLR